VRARARRVCTSPRHAAGPWRHGAGRAARLHAEARQVRRGAADGGEQTGRHLGAAPRKLLHFFCQQLLQLLAICCPVRGLLLRPARRGGLRRSAPLRRGLHLLVLVLCHVLVVVAVFRVFICVLLVAFRVPSLGVLVAKLGALLCALLRARHLVAHSVPHLFHVLLGNLAALLLRLRAGQAGSRCGGQQARGAGRGARRGGAPARWGGGAPGGARSG